MLRNTKTNAILVSNPNEKLSSSDAYAVTASCSATASVRSVFRIEHADACQDSQIRYGQDVRLCTHPELCAHEYYLNSLPVTPMTFSRFSHNQEVSVYHKKAYNTVWRIQPAQGCRKAQKGKPVCANAGIILEHAATNTNLSNDHIRYQNEFGTELEVCCKTMESKHKTQILFNETQGTQVRENVHKDTSSDNVWLVCLASCEEEAAPVQTQTKCTAGDLLDLIRHFVWEAPSLNFACMVHELMHHNDTISLDQLVRALHDLEVTLNESDYQKLFAHFQKNWN